MKSKKIKTVLSDKIVDALTVKPKPDIEDDQVFGTKPQTVSRIDFSSSESDEELAISDFKKRNVSLLSEISKKYVGAVVAQKDLNEQSPGESSTEEDSYPVKNKDFEESVVDSINESKNNTSQTTESNKSEISSSDEGSNPLVPSKSTKPKPDLYSNSDSSDSEDESDNYDITGSKRYSGHENGSTESSEDEGEGYDISAMDEPVTENFEHLKKQNVTEEVKKGNCVRNQLLLWEALLEMRIHLQRCMNTANQMPMPNIYNDLKETSAFTEQSNITKCNVASVLDKLLKLQGLLLSKYPETKSKTLTAGNVEELNPNEEIPSDSENEEIPSDTDAEELSDQESLKKDTNSNAKTKKRKLEDYENELATTHKNLKSFRDTIIQKWNDKTRITTAANIKNTPTNTVLQQISYIMSDKNKLIKRTQLKRSEYDIVGFTKPEQEHVEENEMTINPITRDRKDNDEYITEIFDDSDFYHQLLRELIECKSADISDPVQLSRQWIALQQMRSKMKRKVDTKATKGRKIKYVVHNQLVNFMAPMKSMSWSDESRNELYSSLFGKMFEQNKVNFN